MMYLKSSFLCTSYQGETNLLVFYVVLVDLELEHEGAAPVSTSQPVRRNISLTKSKSASSLSSGKSKKKEAKSAEKSRTGSQGLIMFGGEFLTSFVPEAGVQERMKEHGKDPLWKIKYEQHF
ncbi:unnamed protein product, partial [Porites evermanni]